MLNIGEPCAPFSLSKSILTNDGKVEVQSVQICGRKMPLSELCEAIIHRQESYMYLFTDGQIRKMSEQDIHEFMVKVHYEPNPDALSEELQQNEK